MRYYVLAFGLLLCLAPALTAQVRQGIGINLFPNYSHRRLVAFQDISQAQIDSLEVAERFRPSYAAGLLFTSRAEKVGVQMGLQYSDTGYRGIRTPLPITDPKASQYTQYRVEFRTRQIEVPFSVLFYQALTDQDEFYFLLGTGLSFNFGNQYRTTYYSGDRSETEKTDAEGEFRRINYCFQSAMGWEHQFANSFTLNIAPTFRLWLSGLLREGNLNRNLYQLGVNLSVRWERER
ncbi:MAG: outer membrane beta-barrel protein [Lewinella sp.]|nr:outer membrane beta-barrel protein [Lewinella sp.]